MNVASQPPELLAYKALQAVQRGNAEELAQLIQAGANSHVINAVVKTGTSPNGRPDREAKGGLLYHAVEKQNVDLVKVLLGNGAEVNGSKQDESPPPLRAAVLVKNVELASLLLKRGADVNRKYTVSSGSNKVTMTVLFETTSEPVYKLLLRRGGDAEIKDSNGDTPLHVHAAKWNANFVAALVERGAAVNELDKENRTPLLRALQQWNFKAGSDEEEDFIDICHVFMTHKATVPQSDAVSVSAANSDQLQARLQLLKEWEAQRNAGLAILTHLPVEIFRQGATSISEYFATYMAPPVVAEPPEEVLPEAPRRQSKSGLAAWANGDEVLHRQVEILPALDRSSSRSQLPNSNDVSPIVPEMGRRPTKTSSSAWVSREDGVHADLLPAIDDSPAVIDFGPSENAVVVPVFSRTPNNSSRKLLPLVTDTDEAKRSKSMDAPSKSVSVACEASLGPAVSSLQPAQKPTSNIQLYRLKILGAKGLRRISKIRRQNPYCVCRLVRGDGEVLSHVRTSVHPGGGQMPTWRGQVFELALAPEDVHDCTLVFILKNSGVVMSFDERIAVGMMPFPTISVGDSVTQKLIVMNNAQTAGHLELFIESY